jgi:hypothetical protein
MGRGKGELAAVVVSWQGRAKRLSEPERSLSCQAGTPSMSYPVRVSGASAASAVGTLPNERAP